MLEHIDFFSKVPPMRGFKGSTFPVFEVPVTGIDLTGCRMDLLLESRYTPGEVAFSKQCLYISSPTPEFVVQITSDDTENLSGVYTLYFVLTDSNSQKFYNLVSVLEVLETPQEEEP